ncbi:MAG: M48 family metalloprotease [Clostridia bacterium]|nr:M48 family metalloprotease [Clostridia bacterium]
MNSITFTMYVIYAVLGENVFNIVKEKNGMNITLNDINDDRLTPDNNSLTENQRITLFAYIFLYTSLTKPSNKENILSKSIALLSLPSSIVETCNSIMTEDRIRYILQDFNNLKMQYEDIFTETDDYISDMITGITLIPLKKDKIILNNLSSPEYEHNTDKVALEKLRLNPALEKVIKIFSDYNVERLINIQYTGSYVKVTEKNIPYLYNAVKKVCEILDVNTIPPIYLEQGFINALTIGMKNPILSITNAALSLLTYDELLFLIGHEIGHIKSQHVLYHTLGTYLPAIGGIIGDFTLGIGDKIFKGLELALYNWYRMSEYTADRAGLLACQNPTAAFSLMYKLAGFPIKFYQELNVDDFLAQSDEFENFDTGIYNKIVKILSAAYETHPWTVMRAKELQNWIDSGSYADILNRKQPLPPAYTTTNNEDNMRFCPMCNAQVSTTSKFCPSCGVQLCK